jgi:hypothetical protein
MNKSCAFLLAALTAPTLAAEIGARPPGPRPRVRLDPTTRTAIPAAKQQLPPATSPDDPLMMSPFVVKSTVLAAEDPQQEAQPLGPFSPLEGGWISRKDFKSLRFETGVWPYRNILWKTDRFKSDLKHVGTEFIRITW